MEGRGRRERLEALYETLAAIRESGRQELTPSLSLGAGVVYPEALRVAAKYGLRDTDLLDGLVGLGALEKLYHDSVVACPKCGSIKLFSKLRCPHCGSENLKKIAVVAHATCGGINTVDEDAKNPRCSKCGKPLAEMTVIGRLYQCLSCGARFETPLPAYKCADCGHTFDYREARYVTVYKYRVKRENLESVAKKLLTEIAREVAAAEGFKIEAAAQVRGASGFQHAVDLALTHGKGSIYVDVVAESSRAMSETLANLAKTPDLQSKHIVLAPKSVESSVQRLARGNLITYSDAHELEEKLRQTLKEEKTGKSSASAS
jgi:DNA-directed RNA polymerase subunit RPC12/RpoP